MSSRTRAAGLSDQKKIVGLTPLLNSLLLFHYVSKQPCRINACLVIAFRNMRLALYRPYENSYFTILPASFEMIVF